MSEEQKEIVIAYCGLICSQCGAFKKQRCLGCHSDRPMNRRCKVKKCAMEKGITTCGQCDQFDDLKDCVKLNNFTSKFFGLIFKSDRIGNLNRIRQHGMEQFRQEQLD